MDIDNNLDRITKSHITIIEAATNQVDTAGVKRDAMAEWQKWKRQQLKEQPKKSRLWLDGILTEES